MQKTRNMLKQWADILAKLLMPEPKYLSGMRFPMEGKVFSNGDTWSWEMPLKEVPSIVRVMLPGEVVLSNDYFLKGDVVGYWNKDNTEVVPLLIIMGNPQAHPLDTIEIGFVYPYVLYDGSDCKLPYVGQRLFKCFSSIKDCDL